MKSSFISSQSLDREFESSACQVGHTIARVVRKAQDTIANFQNPAKFVKEGSKIHMKWVNHVLNSLFWNLSCLEIRENQRQAFISANTCLPCAPLESSIRGVVTLDCPSSGVMRALIEP
jgi:hypothetical protein